MPDHPRFKVDENLPVDVAAFLHQAGYDAETVWEEGLNGASDLVIATACQRDGRALLTLGTDFADIRAYPPAQYAGLVVLRLKRQDKPYILELLIRLRKLFSQEPLGGRLWIVEEEHVRIRE